MDAAPSPGSSLYTPSAALSNPISLPESEHRCPLPPRGEPQMAGQRWSSLQPRSLLQSPLFPGTPSLTVTHSPRAPLLWTCSEAPGWGAASTGSPPPPARRADGPEAPAGWAAARAQEHHSCAPSPLPPPTQARSPSRGAHRPTPTKPKKRKKNNSPDETLQLSQQQAEALLPTQMWGSFQDSSSG